MVAARNYYLQQDLEHVAGTLHWAVERSESCMIYSLDVETGMLRDTLLPLPWGSGDNKMDVSLTDFGEHSLAVCGAKPDANTWRCVIMLVYDHNLNNLYTIDLEKDTCHVLRPLVGFRNNGEALFPNLDLNNWGLVYNNMEIKDFKEFVWEIDYDVRFVTTRNGRKGQRELQRVRPFIETLVLLNDRHAMETPTPRFEETDMKEDVVI
ncbi:hypothetical protein DCAR_0521003 [Daucus carota subsp. sativus]|uniref:Uncharacterized protein n=1 Tax=Daucus carota subsp. sativus TaxID=79200 RepID=A0A164Z071_DAUCS|nr:hypothetical protein DCAR_0521003 [Daucus carota subsp. sativus]